MTCFEFRAKPKIGNQNIDGNWGLMWSCDQISTRSWEIEDKS